MPIHQMKVAAAWMGSAARLGRGLFANGRGPRPEQRLVLYDYEGCPFCRKAREALTELDLDAEIRPCPKGGQRFRPEAVEKGGRSSFPFLIDPNQDAALYESSDIVAHLYRHYGTRRPLLSRMGPIDDVGSAISSGWRLGRGLTARASHEPAQLLELWSFEASPYCRLVRECLSELELGYVLHNVGKTSPSRAAFIARSGKMMVPYLADPNTGVEMHESQDILEYLERTYALLD